ncbi:MAG: sulfotransferase [Geminicoccaceae bacterium]
MPLKIIGAGFGRTGTASLKIALEKLGFGPCYHMSEVLARPEHVRLWTEVGEGRPDFARIFADFSATVDFPACIYWRELLQHYPDAKVILSVRDAEKWYRSTQETILGPRWWDFVLGSPFGAMCQATIGRFLNDDVHGHDHLIAAFERHVAAVKAAVPPERLLVFEARDGWAPLCRFLRVAAPAEPFPHVNSEAETQALFASIIAANAADQIGGRAIEEANEAFSSASP